MADSTNLISLQVVDAVSPDIAPKLILIADASIRAAASVGTLADAFATLKGSGVGALSTMLDKLETSTLKASVAQTTLNTRIQATTASTGQLAVAQGTVSAALQATTQASRANQNATAAGAATTGAAAGATRGLVSANISAAAGLGILEGRTLSMNRAAANFITRILGLGPALQSAFVVIGAVAMVAVIVQMGKALYDSLDLSGKKAREIAEDMRRDTDSMRMLNDSLNVELDKIQIANAKLEHKPVNGMKLAIDEALESADKLGEQLDRDLTRITATIKNMAGSSVQQFLGLKGGTDYEQIMLGEHARWLSEKTSEQGQLDESESYGKSLSLRLSVLNDLKKRDSTITNGDYDNEISAVKHMIAMQEQEHAAIKTTITLQEELKKHGGLIEQHQGESLALKQERKDWEALTAAFDKYQAAIDNTGHKPTAQQNLSFLQSQKVSGGNVDKLAAKELPFENTIASNKAWSSEQSNRLQAQVNEIGLYSDALKEAQMWKTISIEADKRGVVFTDAQTASLKDQIRTIVESKDYQKALQSEYDAVNTTRDDYAAKVHALNDLFQAGVYTQDQYTQAIIRTIRAYSEASNVVVAFQRKLDEQKRDAPNKLGSTQDIAVKAQLQTLAEEMRKGDSTHPGGYKESEIAAVLDSKRGEIKAQLQKNEVDQAANKLIFEQTNLYDQLVVREKALTLAVEAGVMSQKAANAERLKDWNQQNDQQLKMGTGGSTWKGALADYAKSFTTVAVGIKESLSSTFKTLADGIADSIGRALAGAKNLGQALKDVAKAAVGELISSLVKLAIEYLIVEKIMKAFKIKPMPTVAGPSPKQAAEGVAGMAAITIAGVVMTKQLTGPMWSLAAALAGVTFGISAAAGASGITALGAAEAAASTPKLAVGTNYIPQDMLAIVHKGEAVVPAAYNPSNPAATNAARQTGPVSNGGMKIEIHNHNGSRIETQQMDENTVRLIVRDEGKQVVAAHAPDVIAGHLNNPNSKVSKAVSNNTFATRRR